MTTSDTLRVELARRVNRSRVRQFLSVSELSRMTDIPRTTLSRQLRGERGIDLLHLITLGAALNVNFLDWLPTELRNEA